MNGATLPIAQFVFMEWCSVKSTGTTLPLPVPVPLPNDLHLCALTGVILEWNVTHIGYELEGGAS
jgi:hypothetical protein